jgi:chromate transporter
MRFLYLFGNFFAIGLLSVGGGYAILPFLFDMADRSSGWLSREMIGDMLAVAQSLPGAIGANLSAYVGFQYAGIGGGFASAFGLVAPALIIITLIAGMFKAFKESSFVKNLLAGLRPAAAGLLSAAALGAIALALWNPAAPVWFEFLRWKEALIFAAMFFFIVKFKKQPIVYIKSAAIVGIVLKL